MYPTNHNANLNFWNGVLLRKHKYCIGFLYIYSWEVDKFSYPGKVTDLSEECALWRGDEKEQEVSIPKDVHPSLEVLILLLRE